jgi:hypothetical protein
MLRSPIRSLTSHVTGFGVRGCVALLALGALTLALAGPLLVLAPGGDASYCCRSGRCCCDSGNDSPERLDLKTACRCARPDGTAVVFALPLGWLAPGPALSDPALAEPLARRRVPTPQDGETSPLDQPPRLSRTT